MKFRLGLAQCAHRADGDAITLVETYAKQAQEQQVGLLVFPESLMTPFEKTAEEFLESAQSIDGNFAAAVSAIAARYNLWIVFTVNEKNPKGGLPFNTAVVVDSAGKRQGVYRKVHLFDAYTFRESERMSYGDQLFEPITTPFGKLGIGICYDLRFPELARSAALTGADIIIYPAAWVDGDYKAYQWKTLLAARAIENECFVAGLSRCDDRYIGESYIYDPMGIAIASSYAKKEMLVVGDIDTDLIEATRKTMPIFEHRREELY